MKSIGLQIKLARIAKNIRQGKLARRLGITQNYLSLIEGSKCLPSVKLLKKLSIILDMEIKI